MAATNGFFGQLQGPFNANEELFNRIKADCKYLNKNSIYVTKLGIHIVNNYDLKVTDFIENSYEERAVFQTGPRVFINEKEFQIGQTGMLELEDVQITSIKFTKNIDSRCFIDYQLFASNNNEDNSSFSDIIGEGLVGYMLLKR